MRRSVVGVVASGVLFAFAAAAPVPKGAGPPKFDIPKELGEAYDQFQKSQTGEDPDAKKAARTRFSAILQKIAPALPEIKPEKGEAKKYTKVTLNGEKKQLGAFRFRTPEGKTNWDMNWEFVYPPGTLRSWYILPREGTMTGFRTFTPGEDYQEEGANLPEKNRRVVQPLDGGVLKPDTDYVIWFTFAKDEPVDFHIRIGLTEAKPKE